MSTPPDGFVPPAPAYQDGFLTAAGARCFVRVWGDLHAPQAAPPMVLFHDSLGCVELWRDFPPGLAALTGRPVIAYDRPGFGRSDPVTGPLPFSFIEDNARTIVPILRAELSLDRMVLFGHSVGGAMAIATAIAFPRETLAVVTVSAMSFVEGRTVSGLVDAKAAFADPSQIERLARYHGDKARWVLSAWIDTWLSPAFANWTLDAPLAQLPCPILAIHGDRDEYGSPRHAERIAAAARTTSEVVVLEDCGHLPHRERPDHLQRAVKSFLDRHLVIGS